MRYSNRELWWAFGTVIVITLIYLFVVVVTREIPGASDLFGHSLGIIGFILMLMTETLYSLRKRSRRARWGKMASWLRFHIYTGLVGPYMILLHSSWKFNGVAGLVFLLTVLVVISGFVGRYIYTAVPRTADGIALEARELEARITLAEEELKDWASTQPATTRALATRFARLSDSLAGGDSLDSIRFVMGRMFQEWHYRIQWWLEKWRLDEYTRAQANQLENLLNHRRILHRQLNSLAIVRRLLGLWHAVHLPIGLVLFTSAFIHIVAAIYYATLLR